MTVCIAAFAAKSKAIVLVADKALTYAGGMQSDTSVRKILPLRLGTWHALVAGNAGFATEVIQHTSKAFSQAAEQADDADTLVSYVVESYITIRQRRINSSVVRS